MKTVLVTGADGFIGRHLVETLLERNYEVYAVIRPKDDVCKCKENSQLHIKYMDLDKVMEHVKEFPDSIDVMYHLAWGGVHPEFRDNIDIQMGNMNMSVACVKFAIAKGIKKIIFPGSTNEYLYYRKPLNKNAIPSPQDAYGAVKIACRYLCSSYAEKNGVEFIYTIITGIYAEDRRDNNVIFYTIDKLMRGEKPILTKLEQLWDYIYIDDVIDALILTGEKGRNGAVYAIGHGDNWPLSNYIRIIHNKIDSALPLGVGELPYTNKELPCSCVDMTDIINDTGFIPQIDFDTGIAKVIDKIREDMKREK